MDKETTLLTAEVYSTEQPDGADTFGFRVNEPLTGKVLDGCSGYGIETAAQAALWAAIRRL